MSSFLPLLVTADLQDDSDSLRRMKSVNHHALALAKRLSIKTEVLHVANLGEIAQIPHAATAILTTKKSQLENLVNPFAGFTRAKFSVGHPVSTIQKFSTQKKKYSFLVQGTSGKKGLSRIFLGSVAEEVLRSSKIPVVTIGPEAQKIISRSRLETQEKPMILFATDFGRTSLAAEQVAIKLAKSLNGKVHAVHHLQAGFHPLIQTAIATPSGSRELQSLLLSLKQEANKSFQKLATRLKKSGIELSYSLVEKGASAPEALIQEIKKVDACLIVLGTHARSLPMATFLGSTCRGVLLGSPVPVVTAHR